MNGLANWDRLIKGLSGSAAVVFVLTLWQTHVSFTSPPNDFSQSTAWQLFTDYKSIEGALGTAITVTGLLFWIFTKWLWRLTIFRKLGVINFPDLSGTWHATLNPGLWGQFTAIASIDHSFYGIRVALIRNQSRGRSRTATLERTDQQSARLYVVYYSEFGELRPISRIPAVDHGEDHSGTLSLDLNDESVRPSGWVLEGEYWTNKRKDPHDDHSKGTWGRIAMEFRRREPAPIAVRSMRQEDQEWLEPPGTCSEGGTQNVFAA